MLGRRISKLLFATQKREIIPKAPKFLSGQLEPFRFDAENAQLYQGYTIQQLYGAKVGPKLPPAIRAQMAKDTIAASLILIIGFGMIYHLNTLFRKQLEGIERVEQTKLSKTVILPQKRQGDLH